MHFVAIEIPPPKNEDDFERMCAHIYGVVFKDPMPKMNGRRGQSQEGVDVFVKDPATGRVGIQCKKYYLNPVKWDDVTEEVRKADKGKIAIKRFIIATVALNDAVLLKQVQELSDEREAQGLFTVEIEFWGDICNRINGHPSLQDSYSPNTPGALFQRTEATLSAIHETTLETRAAVMSLGQLPGGRDDSVNKLITAQLDRTNDLLTAGRYREALEHLAAVGADMLPFDNHQKARWHAQKGIALWLSRDGDKESADHFLTAYALYPDDERMAAANVRGLMLKGQLASALEAGKAALERFPVSDQVWYAYSNARLMNGETLQWSDVPAYLESEPDAMQFVAQAALNAGNLDEAIRLTQSAASNVSAGFFVRAAALKIAIHCGARLPPGAMHGAMPEREKDALLFAVKLFEPRLERLWAVQSETAKEVAGHLGFAFLMLGQYSDALNLVNDAEANRFESKLLLRVHIIALSELGQDNEVQKLATSRSVELDAEGVVMAGQVAANRGNIELLTTLAGVAAALDPPHPDSVELMAALRWEALDRAGQRDIAANEILAAELHVSGELIFCCVGGRVLNRAGLTSEANAIARRAQSLVTDDSDDGIKLALADLFFALKNWSDAAELFVNLSVPGTLSELHKRALFCYVRSHNRKRAKELLGTLPSMWQEDDAIRQLAIELGRQARDWVFLTPLLAVQVKKYPEHAGSWLLKLSVSLHSGNVEQIKADLEAVPDVLEGQIQQLVQLARMELRHGEQKRGMRRLYRLVRANLDEPEALAGYFIAVSAGPGGLPNMEAAIKTVADGCAISLTDEVGNKVEIVIDPGSVGPLPKREGYCDSTSQIAQALMGAKVGDKVQIPMAFGDPAEYEVAAVQSAFLRLLQVAWERADSIGGLPHMKSIPIRINADGTKDLGLVEAEVLRSSSVSAQIAEHYGNEHLTVAMYAQMRGQSSADAALAWAQDGPPLAICKGTEEELNRAFELLRRTDVAYVIDSLTIADLVSLGMEKILKGLPRVLVSPLTKALLQEDLWASDYVRRRSLKENKDEQAEAELHEKRRQQRLAPGKAMLAVVEQYCTVQPAYGELELPSEHAQLVDVLEDEEVEVLMLARAQGATVLTIDGKFRALLEYCASVPGVWPQALLMHCGQVGLIEPAAVCRANIHQFLRNRTFVFLNSGDLVWLVLQGGDLFQHGMQRFKKYFGSNEAEFESTLVVAFEFLAKIARQPIHLGAFGELFEHVIEAALRNPQCPEGFDEQVAKFVLKQTAELNSSEPGDAVVDVRIAHRIDMQRRYLAEKMRAARIHALQSDSVRHIAVRTLFCGPTPWIVSDQTTAKR